MNETFSAEIEYYFGLKEKVENYLNQEGFEHDEKKLERITEEFAANIEEYNENHEIELKQGSKMFYLILEKTILNVNKICGEIGFYKPVAYDVVEDDYSDESTPEVPFGLKI